MPFYDRLWLQYLLVICWIGNTVADGQPGLTAVRYLSSTFAGEVSTAIVPTANISIHGASIQAIEMQGTLTVPKTARYEFHCQTRNGAVIMWLDDHLYCGTLALFRPETAPLPPYAALTAGSTHHFHVRFIHNETTSDDANLLVQWRIDDSAVVPIDPAVFTVSTDEGREQRAKLQSTLATGWGTWWRPSALAVTLLPEGATITAGVCQVSTGQCMQPEAVFTPEQDRGSEEPRSAATSRPGVHAFDRSYWQLYLEFAGLNVSLEWSSTNAGKGADQAQEMTLLASVISGNRSDFVLVASGTFVFDLAGSLSSPEGGNVAMKLSAVGLRNTLVWPASKSYQGAATQSLNSSCFIALNLDSGVAALSTGHKQRDLQDIVSATKRARDYAENYFNATISDATLSEAATAMMSALMWNTIHHPTQLGPFTMVSRSFTAQPYELFEWDTYFGARMLATDQRGLALGLSSFIQITKSKTIGPELNLHGFVPGYSKGGRWLSEDRTERPVAATLLLQIYNKWHSKHMDLQWLLNLLYPDLLDWQNWLWSERRLAPLQLAGMGSDNCVLPNGSRWCKPSWGMGQLQGARFESLDNSPMYDPPVNYSLWDSETKRMRLYDVGQSAAVAFEAEALAEIANVLGHTADAKELRLRQQTMSRLIADNLWSKELNVYSNMLFNGSLYPRIAPTSFYPLLANIPSDDQVRALVVHWLTNQSRFCVPVSPSHWPPSESTADSSDNRTCYWGVPSISADDPDFLVPGGTSGIYWRGETWSPQAFLVYLCLQQYPHVSEARDAAAGLVKQQLDLMLSVWRSRHHVCENYPSYRNETAGCTGNQLYMWGALPALMAMMEAGI